MIHLRFYAVTDPNRLYLAVIKNEQYTLLKPASLVPVIGYNVFDTRHYTDAETGEGMTERHLGNKVSRIEFE